MKDDLPPELTFDALRARGVGAAQDSSGNIWTDYNLHDPGVTLLEQTAFALTEAAYMGDHPVRDLLTDPRGKTGFDDLALFDAEQVLPGRPITLGDIAGYLSDLEGVERVFARVQRQACLIDLVLVPSETLTERADQTKLIARVRKAFDQVRLLTTGIGTINIATPKTILIEGGIRLTPFADPDRVGAGILYVVRHLLRGLQTHLSDKADGMGATRKTTFEDPTALWPTLLAEANANTRLDGVRSAIKRIEGVAEISDFDLIDLETGQSITAVHQKAGEYYDPPDPANGALDRLRMRLADAKVDLNKNAVREELGRIEAAQIATGSSRKDRKDWDVLGAGQRRNSQSADIDALLPAPYRHKPRPIVADQAARHAAQDQLPAYRQMANQHVGRVVAPLGTLHDTFAAKRKIDFKDPAAIRQRIQMLDYLIALQGEDMPVDNATHTYRSARERARWQVEWRESYLQTLPLYNWFQGSAHPVYGISGRLAHLADLLGPDEPVTEPLVDNLVTLTMDVAIPKASIDPSRLILPSRPLDAFVTRDHSVPTLDTEALEVICPWVVDGQTRPDFFRRAADPSAYVVMRNRFSDWELLFDPGEGENLYPCISNRSRDVVATWGNRLHKTFVALNRNAERLTIVEDIILRGTSRAAARPVAHAILPGWTLRTASKAYRQYVEDLVLRIAPAHVQVQVLWLGPAQYSKAETLLKATHADPDRAGPNLRQELACFENAKAAEL